MVQLLRIFYFKQKKVINIGAGRLVEVFKKLEKTFFFLACKCVYVGPGSWEPYFCSSSLVLFFGSGFISAFFLDLDPHRYGTTRYRYLRIHI